MSREPKFLTMDILVVEMFFVCHLVKQEHTIKGSGTPQGKSRPTKFGGHRHCGIGDIVLLFCHVISQDHVFKGSSDLIGRSPSR